MSGLCTGSDEFSRRLAAIAPHGLGLSVDVYVPDVGSLLGALRRRQVLPAYLEVFRAPTSALRTVRHHAAGIPLTYHGEGLWLTEPGAADDPLFRDEIAAVAGHLDILESVWLNHECATKQMAGYSFGTYLPPLYTEESAAVIAENTTFLQASLDRYAQATGRPLPLVLLEMAPLTYFVAGTTAIPEFFRLVTDWTACGLVLDIGHLWTVYRYTGAWRSRPLAVFVDEFLSAFPVERVVQIHVAGLALHEASDPVERSAASKRDDPPLWLDAHAAPIPSVLFDLLDQVLAQPRLVSLRALALEVDTKPIEVIVEEFAQFTRRYARVFAERTGLMPAVAAPCSRPVSEGRPPAREAVRRAYERYAQIVSGRDEPKGSEWNGPCACLDELSRYRAAYVPHEILHWGGDLEAMFPEICRRLRRESVELSSFVRFWFDQPRPLAGPYDFFLLKIERFVEFVRTRAPHLSAWVLREAEALREAYRHANEPTVAVSERDV